MVFVFVCCCFFFGGRGGGKEIDVYIMPVLWMSFRELYLLVSKMADSLHKEKLKIILVIPPPFYAG